MKQHAWVVRTDEEDGSVVGRFQDEGTAQHWADRWNEVEGATRSYVVHEAPEGVPVKTMAETLAEHEMDYTYDGKQTGCSCGHWQARGPISAHADHAAHQAEALAAAGYGLVREAQAQALRDAAQELEYGNPVGSLLEERAAALEAP